MSLEIDIETHIALAEGSLSTAERHVKQAEELLAKLQPGEVAERYHKHLQIQVWLLKKKVGLEDRLF